jgi:hypothetical protein
MAEAKKTQEPETPESTALVIVKSKNGGTHEMIREKGSGQFVKKNKPLIPTIEFTRKDRKILNRPSKTKEGLTEHEVAFLNILRIAQNESTDPKAMMAAVNAYEVMTCRAFGKPASSEQDLDRITTQAVRTIVVVAPPLMHPEVQQDKRGDTKTQPSAKFLEVVSIKTNEK